MTAPAAELVIEHIHGAAIDTCWPALEPHFRRVWKRFPRSSSPDDLKAEAHAGGRALWAVYDRRNPLPLLGAFATKQFCSDGRTTLLIDTLAGTNARAWLDDALAIFERMAVENGIYCIEIEGRFGWQRWLRDYEPRRIVLGKILQ